MGKKIGGLMIKRTAIFFILSIFLILIGGCETIKGAFSGAADGAKKDWKAAKQADQWMRDNLW